MIKVTKGVFYIHVSKHLFPGTLETTHHSSPLYNSQDIYAEGQKTQIWFSLLLISIFKSAMLISFSSQKPKTNLASLKKNK
jgi:hypothetical protein